MTRITLTLEDHKVEALRRKAENHGLNIEQLISASLDELVGLPEEDFERAMKRVLAKNRELYQRLA